MQIQVPENSTKNNFPVNTSDFVYYEGDSIEVTPLRVMTQKPVYGSLLMATHEINEYHSRISNAKTQTERQQVEALHREFIFQRAEEEGMTLLVNPGSLEEVEKRRLAIVWGRFKTKVKVWFERGSRKKGRLQERRCHPREKFIN